MSLLTAHTLAHATPRVASLGIATARPALLGSYCLVSRRSLSFFSASQQATAANQPRDPPPSLQLHQQRLQQAAAAAPHNAPGVQMPPELQHARVPQPIRDDFVTNGPMTTAQLEALEIYPNAHRVPTDFADKVALATVKLLRTPTDLFFKKKYVHRAVMLETVAAVPGMVGAMLRHLRSLRGLRHDGGWISHLLHEAENERMHLMTWMRVCKPSWFDRLLVFAVQGGFFNAFFLLYLCSARTAHRVVGYLEEEAIISYTAFLNEIDAGRIPNTPAPKIAIEYWNLDPTTATLRDVVLAVRADEALHRDTNHHFADRILTHNENLYQGLESADWKRVNHQLPVVNNQGKQVFDSTTKPSSAVSTGHKNTTQEALAS
ncbi:inducible alternative oxidase 2 [Dimargaris verticillata]|uniref:Alternative oxidase n=1 Tax=Dimargaris verticillata TaxID=2761393 RepID=A0A9W8E6B7_9FUNG|nr:inducible alternative oxidase 2 [Dimargaris verticillata]